MDNIHPDHGTGNEIYAFPTSYAQQRLWFLHRLEPDSPAYNIPVALRLSGSVNVTALEKSFQEVVRRHETLRTTFSLLDGEPKQIIAPVGPAMSIVDLRSLREPDRDKELHRRLAEETTRCFDLAKGPLFRVSVLRMDDQESILIINMHHIISDGWSIPVLFREIAACYAVYSHDGVAALPELPIQYADYAIWQRDSLQAERLEAQLSFWRKRLEGVAALKLPADRPRAAVQSCRGAKDSVTLSSTVVAQLKTLSRQEGVTLFMSVLAAFQAFLCRYTGQDDISVGTPIAGRTRRETEDLIGFFVNTLVLRTDLSGEPTFRELLARVRKLALDAYEHQDLPFEKLVQELNPDRSLSQTPLFQVMFAFHNASESGLRLHGLNVSRVEMSSEIAKFDLSAFVGEKDNSLTLSFFYNTDLFDAATIRRWLSHFQSLFEAAVANPDQKLTQLPLLSEAENHQLLVEWNNTTTDYPKESSIHRLFEAQVDRTPDTVAVILERRRLTYEELNQRANQVAQYLKEAGVGRGKLVGICVDRSLEMIVGLLGILKAGAAYVPLDPDYPKERLAFMLEDTQLTVLITQEALLDQLPKQKAKIVCLDRDWPEISLCAKANPGTGMSAEDLAYVIYTSGSSGQPKGVAIPHRAVIRLVINTDYVRLSPSDVMAQASNISFDAATFEIWGALLNGARLVVVSKEALLSPEELSTSIERHGITVLFLTTAIFNQMVERIPAELGKLRHLLFGGEAVNPQLVRELLETGGPERLVHVYGPTETTTFASWYLGEKVAREATTVPIGRPIANTQLYILDCHVKPVPVGVAGELYIGGDGLARGYLNHPELTAEKFITHSFDGEVAERLYKTGDLARYLADGNVEFLGRIDNQVKIRGYRIEPGEIESTLNQCTGVRESAVIARVNDVGEKCLVAYVVANANTKLNSQHLRLYLKEKLPEYMIPTAFVFLASLPLTPNGKLDRRALPEPVLDRREDPTGYVAPRTAVEQVLAGIWAEVLRVERVSIHDNFFDLGGHSLMGIRLIDHVCKELQIELPVRRLFECPTVARLAGSLDADLSRATTDRRANSPWRYLIELKPGQGKQPIFFLPGGVGGDHEFLVYARLTHFVGDKYTFYGLRARSADGTELAHPSVEEMATDYLSEMRELQPEGPYFIVAECIGGIVAYEIARQLQSQGQRVGLLALMDTGCPSTAGYLRYRLRRILTPWQESYYVGLRHHLKELKRLNWGARLPYFLSKSKALFRNSPQIAANARLPVPVIDDKDSRRLRRVQEGYIDTLSRYRPRPYDGDVIMLVNEKSHPDDLIRGWPKYIKGKIDLKKIPGDHAAYIRRYVRMVGAALKECLDGVDCLPS